MSSLLKRRIYERWRARLTGYSKFDEPVPKRATVSPDGLVRDGYFERSRERVGVKPQDKIILPNRLELLPGEHETFRVGRRAVLLARLVETHEQGQPVAQLQ
jgi:hypothetical protein